MVLSAMVSDFSLNCPRMVLDLTYIHQDDLILKVKNNHFKKLGMEKVDIALLFIFHKNNNFLFKVMSSSKSY